MWQHELKSFICVLFARDSLFFYYWDNVSKTSFSADLTRTEKILCDVTVDIATQKKKVLHLKDKYFTSSLLPPTDLQSLYFLYSKETRRIAIALISLDDYLDWSYTGVYILINQ